jgi:hypothetical protein
MEVDRSLFGEGPYPSTGPLAIVARTTFVLILAAILFAVLLPENMIPQFVRSHYLQHFAAFYLVTLSALGAAPRQKLRTVAVWMFGFATALELAHLIIERQVHVLVDNWVADVGGVAAALAPAFVERFRRRFRPKPPAS